MEQFRKKLRQPNFDYRIGIYFVTVCVYQMQHVLAAIFPREDLTHPPETHLTKIGKKVKESIEYIDSQNGCSVISYVIMPNHIHLILEISDNDLSLDKVMHNFKSFTTHNYGKKLWQRSYYDHIIRNEKDLREKTTYVENNPAKWETDKYYNK